MSLDKMFAEQMDRVRGEAVKEIVRQILGGVGSHRAINEAVIAEVRTLLREDADVRAALKASVIAALTRKDPVQ